jgi:hypothetical protein
VIKKTAGKSPAVFLISVISQARIDYFFYNAQARRNPIIARMTPR